MKICLTIKRKEEVYINKKAYTNSYLICKLVAALIDYLLYIRKKKKIENY